MVMTITNRYKKRSHISEAKFRQLLRLFSLNIDATNISKMNWKTEPTRYPVDLGLYQKHKKQPQRTQRENKDHRVCRSDMPSHLFLW